VNIVGILGGFLDFIAEGSDAAIHAARGDEIVIAPDLIEQRIPCQHPAGVFEEMTQEAIFLGGQLDGFALTGQAAGGGIQDTDAESVHGRFRLAVAAKKGVCPGQKGNRKRLTMKVKIDLVCYLSVTRLSQF
jgi:hypothetical protein